MDDKNVFGMEEWKTRFLETRQPPLKLKIALEHYFTEGEGEWKERCGGYLKLRLRPAVDALIAGNETVKLRQLLQTGWFTRRIVDEAIDRASGQNRTEIVAMLLKWKYEAEDTEGGANPYRGRNECGVGEEDCRGRKTAEPPESVQQVKKRVCDNIWQISILSVSGIYPFFRTFLCGLEFIPPEKRKEKEKFQKNCVGRYEGILSGRGFDGMLYQRLSGSGACIAPCDDASSFLSYDYGAGRKSSGLESGLRYGG